jgi:two-component system response regulator ResD
MDMTETVLVVDDDATTRDVIVRYLEREGFKALEAEDGGRARAVIESSEPNLVILDLMLPGIDGLSVMRWIRSTGWRPVIMLTALGEETDRIVGLELGADDYVTKPFSPRELIARVKTVLRRSGPSAPAVERLEVGDLSMDAGAREVRKRGVEIRLTAKEFDLLWFIASHPRRVFSRDQIMSRVWGYDEGLDTGTVTVHVRRVREKIEDDPSEPRHLETVWGVGYRFTAGLLTAIALGLFRSVHARLVALTLIVGALPIAAVLLSGIAMFDMHADVVLVAVAVASSMVAIGGALLVTRSISGPLRELRASTRRLARGDFSARVGENGPAELSEVAASFNEMTSRLEELFDARRQLVAWASHDLRAPVSSLKAMLEAIEDGVAEPEHYLPAMQQQVHALRILIDDLFELAQIDADDTAFETYGVPVGPLVESSLDAFAAEASARRISLERRLEAGLPDVAVAPEKIERVLQNLLANAVRHTPPEGSIVVGAERVNSSVVVAVEDTGEGIPLGAARTMFDRFWRGDPSRDRNREGAGLGLAIAKGLVERHGGAIWAEERDGGGARIAFTLPVA